MYLQIVEQVRRAVAAGGLQADDEMPSVRALASEHLINPNTVARAYLELEREGLLTKRRGAGTYVAHDAAGFAWLPTAFVAPSKTGVVPTVVGVPVIAPVVALIARPAGRPIAV